MCLSPVSIPRMYLGRKVVMWCPCGKCEECKKDKQNEYIIRTIEEAMKIKGNVYFVTLTYAPANVPLVVDEDGEIDEETGEMSTKMSLDHEDIKAWKKRVNRKFERRYGYRPDYSYCLCGEYGPQTNRPHYHALFMGLKPEDMETFNEDWRKNYGFVCCKRISKFDVPRVAAYVAKYITKFDELENPDVMKGKVVKPRKITSQGYGMPSKERWHQMKIDVMGEDYSIEDLKKLSHSNSRKCMKVVDKISRSLKYKNNGKEYKLPAYYRKRMFYYPDSQGKMRRTVISDMVARTLLHNTQSDFSRQLVQVANNLNLPDDYQAMSVASKIVVDREKADRERRAKAYFETNIAALRKSIF